MKSVRAGVRVGCSLLVMIGVTVAAQATVLVVGDQGTTVGEFLGFWDGYPGHYVIYNHTVERVFVMDYTGVIIEVPDACPYFQDAGCTGQAYLKEVFAGWITRCGQRYFKAEYEVQSINSTIPRLTGGGGCSNEAALYAITATEVQPEDLPFLPQGGEMLHLVPGDSTPMPASVPAVGLPGLALIALLMLATGVLLLR